MRSLPRQLLMILILLPICSGCSLILKSIDHEIQQSISVIKNPQELLQRSRQAMSQMSGYRWQVSSYNRVYGIRDRQSIENKINGITEMTDTLNFHMSLHSVVNTPENQEQKNFEYYLVNQQLYQNVDGQWRKRNVTSSQIQEMFRLDRTIQDPNYSLRILEEQLQQNVQLHEEVDSYVLKMSTKSPTTVKQYGYHIVHSYLEHNMVDEKNVQFQHYELELRIDKQTYRFQKARQYVNVIVPLKYKNEQLEITANIEALLRGEIQKIIVPPEVRDQQPNSDSNFEDDISPDVPRYHQGPYDPRNKI